ncbi:MAG: ATP-binding protein [Lachnospiraceae bacterium]
MKRKKKINWRSSGIIWTLSLFCFVIVAVSMLSSTYYMNRTIAQEETAQSRRAAYKQLGEDLAQASDYLTQEVRFFSVTGDIVHFYNYWEEIFHTRQREKAIVAFEQSHPPVEEKELLDEAKKYSDLLVETEAVSMKLVLLAENKTAAAYTYDDQIHRYVTFLFSVPLSEKYQNMTRNEMRNAAVEMLYDTKYEAAKRKITRPIEKFQKKMNKRLEQELEQRKKETRMATILQRALIIVELGFVAVLLCVMNTLYIRPLKNYTTQIGEAGVSAFEMAKENLPEVSILRAKIVPYGAAELIQLAEAFNRMIDLFFGELRQRKNAEESMRKARNEAQIANEAKSTFLAQMSHELRTPLNAVNGYTFLLEKTRLQEKQKSYVKGIRASANGLLELINQILDFSKIDSGNLQWEKIAFDLPELLQEIEAVFAPQALQKGLYFRIELQGENVNCLKGDPVRLRQVLVNLIGNALKFTETGGVTVTVRLQEKEAYRCLFYFEVTDTGIGISEEAKEKIFQPFTQSDASITRKYGGTGLGLPICQQLIAGMGEEQHALSVKSTPGKGTTFSFTMDFPYLVTNVKKTVDNTGKIPDFGGQKILLVDDNEINREFQSEILRLCHLQVHTAESGMAALQYLQTQEAEALQLIFMDIRMPELDGYETARRIRKLPGYGEIPIIALTADAVTQVKQRADEAGMDDCLLKPLQQETVFCVLEKYLPVTWKQEESIALEEKETDAQPKELTQNLDQIALFEKEKCLKQLNGNEEAMQSIIQRFILLHAKAPSDLSRLLQKSEFQRAAEEIHQMKGIAGNLCCSRLYECCKLFQAELEKGQSVRLAEYVCIWKETYEVLKQNVPKEIKQQPDKQKKAVLSWVEQVYQFSKEADTEAVMLLEAHIQEIEEFCDKSTVEVLKAAMLRFDFEGIENGIMPLLSKGKKEEDTDV